MSLALVADIHETLKLDDRLSARLDQIAAQAALDAGLSARQVARGHGGAPRTERDRAVAELRADIAAGRISAVAVKRRPSLYLQRYGAMSMSTFRRALKEI